jgi:hypothetical protein
LDADSVRGTAITSYMDRGVMKYSRETVGFALESVQHIEQRGTNVLGTVGLVYLALNVVLGIALLIDCSSTPEGMLC